MSTKLGRIAVFIDLDNLPGADFPTIFARLNLGWDIHYCRGYGVNLEPKLDTLRANGILPVEVTCNTKGKNSTDAALIVDAMEELLMGKADGFAIVTADGDFTRLVFKIREKGRKVVVFGDHKAPESLRTSCNEFVLIEPKAKPQASVPAAKPSGPAQPKLKPQAAAVPHLFTQDDLVRLLAHYFDVLCGTTKQPTLRALEQVIRKANPNIGPVLCKLKDSKGNLVEVRDFTHLIRVSNAFKIAKIAGTAGESADYLLTRKTLPDPPVK
jgi:uncharacterized LabA/DUF88 family protein